MKPIKPRPLSTRLLTRIKTLATFGPRSAQFDSKDARAILAALEHTKQQTQRLREAAGNFGMHECPRNGKCRECREFGKAMDETKP